MFIVRKLSTNKVHITSSKDSYNTLCGQPCQSNLINDCNNGFGDIKSVDELMNVPDVTCKKCREINDRR